MTDFRYGPVELYLVGFPGEGPDEAVMTSLRNVLDSGAVRLLDFILLTRSEAGEVRVVEVEDDAQIAALIDGELSASGIVGDDDIAEFAALIPPGSSAALVALELAFARELAANLSATGGVVLTTERVPAPVVNAMIDVFENETEGE